jgi:hypothetical protein
LPKAECCAGRLILTETAEGHCGLLLGAVGFYFGERICRRIVEGERSKIVLLGLAER